MWLTKNEMIPYIGELETRRLFQHIANDSPVSKRFLAKDTQVIQDRLVPKTGKMAGFVITMKKIEVNHAAKTYRELLKEERLKKYHSSYRVHLKNILKVIDGNS